jgi:hypothetical protein
MNGLARRLERLETAEGVAKRHFFWVRYTAGGGFIYGGTWYVDAAELAVALGHDPDTVLTLGWCPGE